MIKGFEPHPNQLHLEVGDTVVMLSSTIYSVSVRNPRNTIGKVTRGYNGDDNTKYMVRWSNGENNDGYRLGRDVLRLVPTKGLQLKFKNVKVSIL